MKNNLGELSECSVDNASIVPYVHILAPTFLTFMLVFMLGPISSQILLDRVCDYLEEEDCDSSAVSADARYSFLIRFFELPSFCHQFVRHRRFSSGKYSFVCTVGCLFFDFGSIWKESSTLHSYCGIDSLCGSFTIY